MSRIVRRVRKLTREYHPPPTVNDEDDDDDDGSRSRCGVYNHPGISIGEEDATAVSPVRFPTVTKYTIYTDIKP